MIYKLLVLYQLKHFICDYPLQGQWMLGKFKPWPKFVTPLSAHAAVHGGTTFLIALAVNPKIAFWVALFDMVVHFTVDLVKANPSLGGRFRALSADEYRGLSSMASGQATHPELILARSSAKRLVLSNKFFWWALGIDQMAHHLTHYFIIWALLN